VGRRGTRCSSSPRRRPRKPVVCLARARREEGGMESQDLTALVAELLEDARGASSMRSGRTIHGGREQHPPPTVLALASCRGLVAPTAPTEACRVLGSCQT